MHDAGNQIHHANGMTFRRLLLLNRPRREGVFAAPIVHSGKYRSCSVGVKLSILLDIKLRILASNINKILRKVQISLLLSRLEQSRERKLDFGMAVRPGNLPRLITKILVKAIRHASGHI